MSWYKYLSRGLGKIFTLAVFLVTIGLLLQGQFSRFYMDSFAFSNYGTSTGAVSDTVNGADYGAVLTNLMARQSTYRNVGYNTTTKKMFLYNPGVYELTWKFYFQAIQQDTLFPSIKIEGNASANLGLSKMPVTAGQHGCMVVKTLHNFSASAVGAVDSVYLSIATNGTDLDTVLIHNSEFVIKKHRNSI